MTCHQCGHIPSFHTPDDGCFFEKCDCPQYVELTDHHDQRHLAVLALDTIAELSSELLVNDPIRPKVLHDALARYFVQRAEIADRDGFDGIAADWRERAVRHRRKAL